MQIPKLALLLAVAKLIAPVLCLAQSAIENKTGSTGTLAVAPVNDSVVSVQELKMSGKAEPAFKKGTDLLLKGDARGSLVYFERVVAEDPGYYRAYHNIGLAQYQLGEKELAEEAFQRAIDLTNGGFAPSQFALGMILFEKRQFREAAGSIQRGLDMEPDSALGKYFLAVVQFALNLLSDAERSARDAVRLSPDQAEAHILLAKIHERHGDPYAVQADVAAYFKLDPHGPLENEANVLLQRAQKEIQRTAGASR